MLDILWLAYIIGLSKVIKVGGKQNPYEMWQAGNSLAASPLVNSLAGEAREGIWRLRRTLARSWIPPATQATPPPLLWAFLSKQPTTGDVNDITIWNNLVSTLTFKHCDSPPPPLENPGYAP